MQKTDKKVEKKAAKKKTTKKKTADPVFGAPALLPGEDETAYAKLLAGVIEAAKPKDMIEQTWMQDYVRLSWRVLQYNAFHVQLLTKLHSWQSAAYPNAEFRSVSGNIESLERLAASVERRRNVAYRELEGRRELLARRVRDSINQIEAQIVDPPVALIADQSTDVEAAAEPPQYSNDNLETVAPCDSDAVEHPLRQVGIAESESVEPEEQAQDSAHTADVDGAPDADQTHEVESEPAHSYTELEGDEDAA